ncbi:MAG: 4-hydroxy-3-methylbut-2-enyl diphosphate reductase [Thermodesulfobacteriota bacterium]|nr:4-hydroxy-3-methylbut-2-enyl diphosphate reductase [Thermodesulfobacteriota bacterium]
MKILIAKTAGFCMGVRMAVELALNAPGKHKEPIYTYGPLIHNPHVLTLLREKGISILDHIPEHGTGTVIIRAHGVPPQTKESLEKAGFNVIDATCPRVIKVQNIIHKHAESGYSSIIIGDQDHPEVIGLLGYAMENGYVVDSIKDLDSLPIFDKAIIVAQTTQSTFLFEEVKKWAADKFPLYKIFDTICDSTSKRQAEVKRMAEFVDAIIVVGGRNSGNTKRLARIATQSGKPAYHIEEETELDLKRLKSAQCIGITAGASTPRWMIKRVYRALEALPFKKEQAWRRIIFSIQRLLLLTNIYVSLGAGCLCYACAKLQGIGITFPHIFISILYIQSMHILNNLTGNKADLYNDPVRASFYSKNKLFLAILSFVAGGAGLITAYTMGLMPFLFLLVMSIMGLSYNLRLIPDCFTGVRYRRIRDIPGSKTILIALAWGIVTSLFPFLSVSGKIDAGSALVFIWATCIVFARTAFFDILDMQGDRIVGKETIPILLGEKSSLRLLKGMLIIIIAVLFLSSAFHIISSLGFILAVTPLSMLLVFSSYERGYMLPGIRLEFLVETHFILTGIITLLWI